jgi:hypothetical protein
MKQEDWDELRRETERNIRKAEREIILLKLGIVLLFLLAGAIIALTAWGWIG